MANSIDSCGKEDVFKMKEIMAKNNSQSIGIGLGSSNVQMHDYLLPVTHGVKIFLTLMLSLLWISAFLYRSCNHIYVQHFPVGHGISVAFMEMVKITMKPLLLSIIAIFCTWIVCYVRDIIHTHRKKIIVQPTEDVQSVEIKETTPEVMNLSEEVIAVKEKLRKFFSDAFCGLNDAVFNKLIIDIKRMIAKNPPRLEHRLIALAYLLRCPTDKGQLRLTEDACNKGRIEWYKIFLEGFDKELTITDLRDCRFDYFQKVKEIPMKYLDIQDLSLFNDKSQLEKYLSDK